MFATIAPRYDLANRVLSMRFDTRWRRLVAGRLLARPGLVLDMAAGTGDLTVDLYKTGGHRVVSADFTYEMLLAGREKLASTASSCPQLGADALELPFAPETFDGAAVAFGIRNFHDPLIGLTELTRVIKPGGAIGILEFSTPSPIVNFFYRRYFTFVLPRLGGALTGSRDSYEYLTRSVDDFPEGPAFLSLMKEAGLTKIEATRLTGGISTFYRGEKPCLQN